MCVCIESIPLASNRSGSMTTHPNYNHAHFVLCCAFALCCFGMSRFTHINRGFITCIGTTVPVCTLTHWGRVTHIYVGKLIIIGSDNGLSPDRRQAIIWTNAWLLSIGHLRKYFIENLINVQQFSLMKMHVKMSSVKWRPSCLGLNVLILS